MVRNGMKSSCGGWAGGMTFMVCSIPPHVTRAKVESHTRGFSDRSPRGDRQRPRRQSIPIELTFGTRKTLISRGEVSVPKLTLWQILAHQFHAQEEHCNFRASCLLRAS